MFIFWKSCEVFTCSRSSTEISCHRKFLFLVQLIDKSTFYTFIFKVSAKIFIVKVRPYDAVSNHIWKRGYLCGGDKLNQKQLTDEVSWSDKFISNVVWKKPYIFYFIKNKDNSILGLVKLSKGCCIYVTKIKDSLKLLYPDFETQGRCHEKFDNHKN